ncbi:DUF2188 domain-containing protein [Pontibacillus salicampi]|uniref:DUF2188 domain-containing protein n=1 Tax=Pontibacillus salicampi TaxID=1449801 RepID=A0ABV6LMI0_9BACI
MPWDTENYPSSLKNLDLPVRKKTIEIANAMLDEGYEEGRAIPIATEQAKEWFDNASQDEIEEMRHKPDTSLKQRDPEDQQYENRPELLDKGEHVVSHENGWAVQAAEAKKPAATFSNKADAINRAKDIASNKGTQVVIHKKDGTIQETTSY